MGGRSFLREPFRLLTPYPLFLKICCRLSELSSISCGFKMVQVIEKFPICYSPTSHLQGLAFAVFPSCHLLRLPIAAFMVHSTENRSTNIVLCRLAICTHQASSPPRRGVLSHDLWFRLNFTSSSDGFARLS